MIAVLLGGFFMSGPAFAQAGCGDRSEIVSKLESRYQEQASAIGLADKSVVELFVSESGSWTILMTTPTGVSCMIAAGTNWESMPPKPDKSQWRDS